MKQIVLLIATSLMLVAATIVVAIPNTVEADKPNFKWCVDRGAACAATKELCLPLIPAVAGGEKCQKVKT